MWLIFESTLCMNKYNVICAPFIGINHHWKNISDGCAFLFDETISSQSFASFLKAMENKALKQKVFSNIKYHLYESHTAKNGANNVGRLCGKLGFRNEYLNSCMAMSLCKSLITLGKK